MNPRTYDIIWREIPVRITHTPQWCNLIEHLEIESRDSVPLPITETGYRSHFLSEAELQDYDDPVEYVIAWLDQEAESEEWKNRQDQARQFSLF